MLFVPVSALVDVGPTVLEGEVDEASQLVGGGGDVTMTVSPQECNIQVDPPALWAVEHFSSVSCILRVCRSPLEAGN